MRPITRNRIYQSTRALQSILYLMPDRPRGKVLRAMRLLEALAMKMRREEVFAAGARARKPLARFEGRDLGSNETCTFYDGYASTHPNFVNPYGAGSVR